MKISYPIVLTPAGKGFTVYIPDFDINTEGDDMTEAIEMARDAIGLMGIDMEDDGKTLPNPQTLKNISAAEEAIVCFVDVDFAKYRRMNERRKKVKIDEPNAVTCAAMEAAEKGEDMYGPFERVADLMDALNA